MSPVGKRRRNAVVPYAIALIGITVLFFGRLALDPILGPRQPYILFYFVILFTAWFWGWRPAAFAAIVSTAVAFRAFVQPHLSIDGSSYKDANTIGLIMAVLLAATIIVLIEKTRRAKAAEERHAEEFRSHFTLSGVGAVQADPHTGRLLRVNARMAEMTGYSEAELLQKTFADLTHPEDREKDMAYFHALGEGQIANYEIQKRFLRKDGGVTWVEATIGMLRDDFGRPLHSAAVIQDVHARKEAEEA
ncbi:MAG TPA: PAS domain S-box protein, partial [Candidatus Limnocylindria bacterium]|nr:PAS domain S-box protein [Candidatus Limnocylindria bacterium]